MATTPDVGQIKGSWNWTLAFTLYCGGSSLQDILFHPTFKGLSMETLKFRATRDAWATRREEIRNLSARNPGALLTERAKELHENLKIEGISHQNFILSELKREKRIIEDRDHDDTIKGQSARLDILAKMDTMARKTLRLDEEKTENRVANGFLFIIQNGAAPQLKQTGSATMTLPDETNASETILRSNNGICIDLETPEIAPRLKEMPAPGHLF